VSLSRIYRALVNLGISPIEARVYIFLALKGPKKTGSIVTNLKINKQQIIRSLKQLQKKGIILVDLESQNVFSALAFEEALESLIKTEKKQTQMIQETKEALLSNCRITVKKNSEK
jgi:sugar-specific transcriptional regulator TrmB